MTTLTRLGLGVLLSLTLATGAWATDGDKIDEFQGGSYRVARFLLCDGATGGATKTCSEFDTQNSNVSTAGGFGQPDFAVIALRDNNTGCGGTPTVTVRGFNDASAAVKHEENDGTALSTTGDTAVILDPLGWRYLDAAIATGTGCTDLEVVVSLFYSRP